MIMSENLREFVKRQINIHKEIMKYVKEYIDKLIEECHLEPYAIGDATYFALILELTRSIYVNWSVAQRQKFYRRPLKNAHSGFK